MNLPTRAVLAGLRPAMALLLSAGTAFSQDGFVPVDLPPDPAAIVAGVDQEKIDFLRGTGILSFAGSDERVSERFDNQSAVEVDPGYTSAQDSNRVLAECRTGTRLRKKDITGPEYLSPLTTEHGHDI
jgi:ABC-type thiamine transport system substrate-binding protein